VQGAVSSLKKHSRTNDNSHLLNVVISYSTFVLFSHHDKRSFNRNADCYEKNFETSANNNFYHEISLKEQKKPRKRCNVIMGLLGKREDDNKYFNK
jgi:hypothetical protein